MSNPTEQTPRGPADPGRRNFLKLPLAVGAAGGLAGLACVGRTEPQKQPQAAPRKAVIGEYDDRNIKLAHRVSRCWARLRAGVLGGTRHLGHWLGRGRRHLQTAW